MTENQKKQLTHVSGNMTGMLFMVSYMHDKRVRSFLKAETPEEYQVYQGEVVELIGMLRSELNRIEDMMEGKEEVL